MLRSRGRALVHPAKLAEGQCLALLLVAQLRPARHRYLAALVADGKELAVVALTNVQDVLQELTVIVLQGSGC
jgi:hypothetical protein